MTLCFRAAPSRRSRLLVSLLLALSAVASVARAADEVEQELDFSSRLAGLGLPQYAARVLERLLVQHPEAKDKAKPVLAELKIAGGKLGEAEEMLKTLNPAEPRTIALQVTLANAYFQRGQTARTRELYDQYFKSATNHPIANTNFFVNAAYQYGQILDRMGDAAGAIAAYGHIVKLDASNGRSPLVRPVLCEQAELMLKLALAETSPTNRTARLAEAEKACDAVIARGLDSWFGKALLTKANIKLANGKRAEARKLLQDNADVLRSIDEGLTQQGAAAQAPLAPARVLLGDIAFAQAKDLLRTQAQTKGKEALAWLGIAMTEYVNVLRKYPGNDAAPEALLKAEELNELLRSLGRPPVDVSRYNTADIMKNLFRSADDMLRAGQYEQAVPVYLRMLNKAPEREISVHALVNLMLAYANQPGPENARLAKMVALYLCERFGRDPRAGTGLLQAAEVYYTARESAKTAADKALENDRMMSYYDLFRRNFRQHPQKGAMLYRLAFLRNQDKDEAGATKLLQQIVDEVPASDPTHAKALGQLAWSYYGSSNYVGAVRGFTAYIASQPRPDADKAQAQLFLAISQKQLGQYQEALAGFDALIAALTPKDNPYNTTEAAAKRNATVLEQAMFLRGGCYASMKEPAAQIPEFRKLAMQAMDELLQSRPDSTFAPKAMRAKGAILLELGKFNEAAQLFDALAAKYPNTDEGKSALFSLARSALEVNQIDQAKAAFNKMLAQADKFAPEYFLTIGRMFADAKLPGEAALAFEQALKTPKLNPAVEEMALFGQGQVKLLLKAYPAAIQQFNALFKKYPTTGFYFDAKFALAEAAREAGQYDVAQAALSDVLSQVTPEQRLQRVKAYCETGKLQIKMGQKAAALASYQIVAQLEDPAKHPETAPWVEEAIVSSARLAVELKRYEDVFRNCDLYEQRFRDGKFTAEIRKLRTDAKFKAGT